MASPPAGCKASAGAVDYAPVVSNPPTETTSSRAWVGVGLGLAAVWGVCTAALRGHTERVDEYSHLPQIRMLLAGDWAVEPSITQIPGYHALVATVARLFGAPTYDDLRLVSTLIGVASVVAFAGCARALGVPRPGLRTVQFAFFPLLFGFRFLLYTDTLSIALVLGMGWAVLVGRTNTAGVLGLASLLVRQTNVPWVAAAPLLGLLVEPGLLKRPALDLLKRHATFVLAGAAFVAFVVINDGVAMTPAEQEKHPLGLNWGNLAFLLITAPLVALPLTVSRAPTALREWRGRSAVVGALVFGALAALFVTRWEVEHGSNLALANFIHNHIVVDVASGVGPRLGGVALAAVGLATVAGMERGRLAALGLVGALSLLPLRMVEPRYWIPVWTVFLLLRGDAGARTERALALWFGLLSAALFVLLVQDRAHL